MPTTIAIEAKPLTFRNIDSGFYHLYLVKTVTDDEGNVVSERVIRGSLGRDGTLQTLAGTNLATSPDRRSQDSLDERRHTVLDLGGRDADDVWAIMVQHAANIDRANLRYSLDIFRELPGRDVNSNSVVASVLNSVGIDWTTSLPVGIERNEAPLYGQLSDMLVNDAIRGTGRADAILGGVGNDRLNGRAENDRLGGENGNDILRGGVGDDTLSGGNGHDRLYGELGADLFTGGAGRDAFVFNTRPDGTIDVDSITDFSVRDDTIFMDNAAFRALGRAGGLRSSAFWTGDEAHDASDRLIYDSDDGVLYYDSDGTGSAEQVAVTRLDEELQLTARDFRII